MEQRPEGGWDLVDGVSVSHLGMAESNDHTRLFDALCELTSKTWTQRDRMQAHGVRSVKAGPAKKASRLAVGRDGE